MAMAILRTAKKQHLKLLRDLFPAITLMPSAQYYVLTLVRLGDSSDIVKIIKRVERANYTIPYWFQIAMGRIVEKRMTDLACPVPDQLQRIFKKRGFMQDLRGQDPRSSRQDMLPLIDPNNTSLYLRLIAHAAIGSAGPTDLNLLTKLAQHHFAMVARASAARLVKLAGDNGIKMLQSAVPVAIEGRKAKNFGLAVRQAEMQSFGV